jgi:hypothetical protein
MPPSGEAKLPVALFRDTTPEQRQKFWDVMRLGDLRKRSGGDDVFVRATPLDTYIHLTPLQRKDGRLRVDAGKTLETADDLLDETVALESVKLITNLEKRQARLFPTQFHSLSRDLLANLETVSVLDEHLGEADAWVLFTNLREGLRTLLELLGGHQAQLNSNVCEEAVLTFLIHLGSL